MKKSAFVLIAATMLSACALWQPIAADNMAEYVDIISGKAETLARQDTSMNGSALVAVILKNDSKLKDAFRGYTVKAETAGRHAVILVCSKDGTKGLWQGANCSFDEGRIRLPDNAPCSFTASTEEICR